MKLYYHKTDGGAEYLYDTYQKFLHNGKSYKEGVINDKTRYIVRIDGDITKDAELNLKDYLCPSCGYNIAGLTNKALRKAGIIK